MTFTISPLCWITIEVKIGANPFELRIAPCRLLQWVVHCPPLATTVKGRDVLVIGSVSVGDFVILQDQKG